MVDPQKWSCALSEISLTERELEVLSLKARRRTNAEIAEALYISITTVKWHVRQIYNKLGVNNRAEAAAAARQMGLLGPRPERSTHPHKNLPKTATPFIGRDKELGYLTRMLSDSDTRLITITGPGGIGKTRLALQVATLLYDQFADNPCWVNFSAQDGTELVFSTAEEYVIATILSTIGLSLQGSSDPKSFLESYLRAHQILFILDRFEHLLPGAALISDLLAGTTDCKFLITSRERLDIPGEILYPIQGLTHSHNPGGDIATTDAVDLFLQTAKRVSNKEYLDGPALTAIGRICHHLEGMPLAIELAADWTRLLPVADVEQELERGLEFLDTGSANIRAVFDRSWNLLTTPHCISLARLAVFQRGFTREAARKVADADLGTLSTLFDKSLVQRAEVNRYSLHDLLRQYAAEQLAISGERETIHDAHCAYYASLLADQREAIFRGDHSRILPDLDNIRAAWQWAVRRRRFDDLRKMLWPLDWFYNLRANYKESMAAMQLVIDALGTPEPEGLQGIVYGKALASYGLEAARVHGPEEAASAMRKGIEILRQLETQEDLAWPLLLSGSFVPNPQEREQNYLESLAIFEELNNPYGIATSLGLILGGHYTSQGRFAEAQQCIERGLAISRSLNDPEGTAAALRALGHYNLHIGRFKIARDNFQEESELWRGLSFSRLVGEALCSVGETHMGEGDFNDAEAAFQESLVEFKLVGDKKCELVSLLALVQIAWGQELYPKALVLLQDSQIILERYGDNWTKANWWQLSGRVSLGQGDLDATRLAFDHALEYSLQTGGDVLTETLLDFAQIYQSQSDEQTAARLLGYAQSQNGLPAALVQGCIEPLRTSLATGMGDDRLALLLKEGEKFDLAVVVKLLAKN